MDAATIQLRPYVGQILMQTLHRHTELKADHVAEEQQRLQFTLVRRAALHYECRVPVWAA